MQFIKNLKAAAVALNFSDEQLVVVSMIVYLKLIFSMVVVSFLTKETECVQVLENCEQLRSSKDMNLLSCLLHLQEYTMMNICVIFTTDVSFENFAPENISLRPPIIINFPQYNQGR